MRQAADGSDRLSGYAAMVVLFLLILFAASLLIVFWSDPDRRKGESALTFYARSLRAALQLRPSLPEAPPVGKTSSSKRYR